MRKLPVNTDDWSGKYKGNIPANTDVNKFMNYVGDDDFFNFIPTQKRVKMTQSGMYKEATKKDNVVGDIAPTGMQSVSAPRTLDKKISENMITSIQEPLKLGEPVKFGDPLKNKKWLVYGLIAVAGYFAYKKFN